MITLQGKSVFGGICIGKIVFYQRHEKIIVRKRIDNAEEEIKRFESAKETAIGDLQALYEKALNDVGEANAAIFEIHQMMLNDLDYCESIHSIIRTQQVNAEYAVGTTADNFSAVFTAMEDAYMQGRAADVKDVSERILCVLSGRNKESLNLTEPVIIAADDLVPSETVQLDKNMVLGFAMMYGSSNSHTAILARTMNIPAVIGLTEELKEEYDGKMGIIDGFHGTMYIEPDEQTLVLMKRRQKEDEEKKAFLLQLKGKKNITLDGRTIKIYANIGSLSDVGTVLQNDAEGIGLLRSEFLYLESKNYPTEEEQFQVYKKVAESMGGKKVIIRTLDIGADKQAEYFNLAHEENPAMGYRAIRICLTQPEIFKTQLRAILRATAYGNISIMFPMIISVEEVRKIKEIVEEVKAELTQQSIPFKQDIELGVMIETPAAVMVSDELAKEVDFFSVGTNDLTQYTLAIDRQNHLLEEFYDAHHPALLRMLQMIATNAHKNGIWAGICGELGADLTLTEQFLCMGFDELSVSPSMVLSVRKKVRETNVEECLKTCQFPLGQ